MARFRFSLERVLDIRKVQEEKLKQELALIGAVLQKEKTALELYKKEQAGVLNEYEQQLKNKKVSIDDILVFQRKTAYYEEVIKDQNILVNTLKEEFEKKRIEVVEASKKRKVLEKLKEKKYFEFKKNEEIADQKTMDEMASNLYFQKNIHGEFYGTNKKSL